MLISTEKRLAKHEEHAKVYQKQIEDMIEREVVRKLSQTELENYKGPIHYISHHKVLKSDSKSTPVRIVFNSSARYMGHVVNDYWAKGPHLVNDLLGVLIRFRENNIAMIGDIKKMYHAVKIKTIEQHTHRFLWRDMDTGRPPDTYVIQRVSFGDKPSGTIATVALRKPAEMGADKYPKAAQVIKENTYMDDIIESVPTTEKATKLAKDIETLLDKGNFKMKEWIFAHDRTDPLKTIPDDKSSTTEKVLGVVWNPVQDEFVYKMNLRTTPEKKRHGKTHDDANTPTKRIILSQVNSIYDPLGLAGPFTARAKILMRELWGIENKLGWDDAIPERYKQYWRQFCQDMLEMNNIKFKRCVKPKDTADEQPMLIIFSDGSSNPFSACAYARWALNNGRYSCRLLLSKNRLAPIEKMSIDRIELCGALLNSRVKTFLLKQCRYKFIKCYHILDSQIVYSMIQKESYGFNTFAATRVREIQQNTNPKEWFWMESKYNIADWITRTSKIRTRFWIVKLLKMVKSIRYNCVICKKLDKRQSDQVMGKLPVDSLSRLPPGLVLPLIYLDHSKFETR